MAAGLQVGKAGIAQPAQHAAVEFGAGFRECLVGWGLGRQAVRETEKLLGDRRDRRRLQARQCPLRPVGIGQGEQGQVKQPLAGVVEEFQPHRARGQRRLIDLGGQRQHGYRIGPLRPVRRIAGKGCQMACLVEPRHVAGAERCQREAGLRPGQQQRGRRGQERSLAGPGQAGDANPHGVGKQVPGAEDLRTADDKALHAAGDIPEPAHVRSISSTL